MELSGTRPNFHRFQSVCNFKLQMFGALHKKRTEAWSPWSNMNCKIYNQACQIEKLFFVFMLKSYVADILEWESILSTNRDTQTQSYRHNCLVNKSSIGSNGNGGGKTLDDSQESFTKVEKRPREYSTIKLNAENYTRFK